MRLHQQECQFDGDAWHRIEHLINPNSLPNKSALSHSAVIVRDSPTVDDLVKLCATHDTLADFPPSTTAHNLFCGLPPVAIIHSLISIFRNPRQHRNLITSQLLLSLPLSLSLCQAQYDDKAGKKSLNCPDHSPRVLILPFAGCAMAATIPSRWPCE